MMSTPDRRALITCPIDATLALFLLPHVQVLMSAGFDVDVACRSHAAWAADVVKQSGADMFNVSFGRRPFEVTNFRALLQLRRIMLERRYTAIHAHMPVCGWISRLAAHMFSPGSRILYTAHGLTGYDGAVLPVRWLTDVAERLAGRWTDFMIVVNLEDLDTVRRLGIVPYNRVARMAGVGVDAERFNPASVPQSRVCSLRVQLGLSERETLLLMNAGFRSIKRHADVLRAVRALDDPTVHVAFAGAGALLDQSRALARELGIGDRTHFLGSRRDIPDLLAASAATLVVSDAEGLSVAALESLSMEVPVIGSDVRGVRELVEGGCGVLAPRRDPQAIARAMRWMVDHPPERRRMGVRGRIKVLQSYEKSVVMQELGRIYHQALGLHDSATPLGT